MTFVSDEGGHAGPPLRQIGIRVFIEQIARGLVSIKDLETILILKGDSSLEFRWSDRIRPVAYTRKRGLDRETNKQLLLKHIEDNAQEGSRMEEFLQVLPGLPRTQVHVLLRELRREGKIICEGRTKGSSWYPAPRAQDCDKSKQ